MKLASTGRAVVEALVYAAMIGLAASRSLWRALRARIETGRRLSERRVTDALAVIAIELVTTLVRAPATLEQRRRWHALLSGEGTDPNLGRPTLKQGWEC